MYHNHKFWILIIAIFRIIRDDNIDDSSKINKIKEELAWFLKNYKPYKL